MFVLINFSNFNSKYSISFDFYFLLLLLLLILFSSFDELKKLNEFKNDSIFVRKTIVIIWVNLNRWALKKSKLNELKNISLRKISLIITKIFIEKSSLKINELIIIVDELLINESLIEFDESLIKVKTLIEVEASIKVDEFSTITKSFEIETKYETIVWNVLTNFLKRVLFFVYSLNQIQVLLKLTNELRIQRSIDSIVKTRKYWRQMFSTINFVNRSIKLSYWYSIFTKFLS